MTSPQIVPQPVPAATALTHGHHGARSFSPMWLWGWLAIVQLVLDLLLAAPYLVVVSFVIAGLASLPAFLVGVPILVVALAAAMGLSVVERVRIEAFTGVHIPPARAPRQDQSAWRRILLDPRPWRASAYLLVISLWGALAGGSMLVLTCVSLALGAMPFYHSALPDGLIALPWGAQLDAGLWPWLSAAGVTGIIVLPLMARGLVSLDIVVGRFLLGRSNSEEVRELSARVQTLTETRVATVDSVEVERRRIERDLHDGPQQRLVAIAMDLGMAREKLDDDAVGARELLDKAHLAAKEAIVEMRQVARGIAPPVLTDRGLDAALSALAARAPVPVDVTVDVPVRPTPTVEAIAYFCVSEALTNVAKHAAASRARVDVQGRDGTLVLRISDDGTGGADATRGTGLNGLRDRVRSVDGTLDVNSPPGGPTILTVTLPHRPTMRSTS